MARVRVFAPAKVNLALHVVGRRADGYHLLDTLVGFASVGDWVELDSAGPEGLTITGPESAGLDPVGGNLVMRAAAEFWAAGLLGLHLDKHLPVSSGIGGGSADAAAAFRGMVRLNERLGLNAAPSGDVARRLLSIGADVPMCARSIPARIGGIGDRIEPLDTLAPLAMVLVNPRVQVSTPAVFKALTKKDNPEMEPLPADLADAGALVHYLARQRNDLQGPAMASAPMIGTVLDRLAASAGCGLARMSGSGATCFGIYKSQAAATAAAEALSKDHPEWWVKSAVLDGQTRAAPVDLS